MTPDFFVDQELDFEQVKAITRGMMAVARVDGVHEAELGLIREFYEGCAGPGDPSLEAVTEGAFEPRSYAALFGTAELAQMFVKGLILLAFADGQYAADEDALIRGYAADFGVSAEQVDHLLDATREYLLAGLSHVQNLDALKEVRRDLERP